MEYDVVIVRPAEAFLKSEPVMRKMMKQLVHNIKVALKNNDVVFDNITCRRLNILIRSPEPQLIINICRKIPGVSTIFPAVEIGSELETLKQVSYELAKKVKLSNKKSFAIRARRAQKNYPLTSREIEEKVGEYVLKKSKAKVNLTKPDLTIHLEILGKSAHITAEKYMGLGGLPAGVSGKIICLMRPTKNDLVAALLMLCRGSEIVPLHFLNDEKDYQKLITLLKKLEPFTTGTALRVKNIKGKLSILKAEKLAKELDAKALCISSEKLEEKHLKILKQAKIPLLTPLIGLNAKQLAKLKEVIFK